MVRVEVTYSPAPRAVDRAAVELPPGATLADALRASGLVERHDLVLEAIDCGIWGRRCAIDQALREGDRVEIYRALTADPMEARRSRQTAQQQAKRPAGAGRSAKTK